MSYTNFNPSVSNANETPSRGNFSVLVDHVDPSPTVGLSFDHIYDSTPIECPNVAVPVMNTVKESTPDIDEVPTADVQFNVTESEIPERKFVARSISINEDAEKTMFPNEEISSAIIANINSHLNNQAQVQPDHPRKSNNWLSRLIDQRGEDYLIEGRLSADEVSRNSERIIDDMIAGRIDYTTHGKYIIMPVFLETLIGVCSNRLAIDNAIQYALGYIYNDYANRYNITDAERLSVLNNITDNMSRNISQAISIINQDISLYGTLYNRLKYVQATKNASSLFNLHTELSYARKQAKKRY